MPGDCSPREPARDGASGLEQRVVEQQTVELAALDTAYGLLRVEPLTKGERVERPGPGASVVRVSLEDRPLAVHSAGDVVGAG